MPIWFHPLVRRLKHLLFVAQYENLSAIPTEPTSVITTAIYKPEIRVCQQEKQKTVQ
jgi:hypothetical protein